MDAFGIFETPSKKETKKRQIRERQRKGKAAEELGYIHLSIMKAGAAGTVKRTGVGHDFEVTRPDRLTGKMEREYYEVKTPKSGLTEKQRETKKRLGKKYKELRIEPPPFTY